MIKRPSLVTNLNLKFNQYPTTEAYDRCIKKTAFALKNQNFTRMLDDYPSLLCREDMIALNNRYIDLLRRLPEKDITEEYQIKGNEGIVKQFDHLIIDIAKIGSKEMLDYAFDNTLDAETNRTVKTELTHDLLLAVNTQLLGTDYSEAYLLFDERDELGQMDSDIKSLIEIISKSKPDYKSSDELLKENNTKLISQDIKQLVYEILLNEKPENNDNSLSSAIKKEAISIIEAIYERAKKDYIISHASLKPSICKLLQIDPILANSIFVGRTVDVTIAYVATVLLDILKGTNEYDNKFINAHLAFNAYLNSRLYHLVKQGMYQPDNTLDLNDQSANIRNTINYPLEHKAEMAVASGLTLAFGAVGFTGFLLFKALTPDQADEENDLLNFKTLTKK